MLLAFQDQFWETIDLIFKGNHARDLQTSSAWFTHLAVFFRVYQRLLQVSDRQLQVVLTGLRVPCQQSANIGGQLLLLDGRVRSLDLHSLEHSRLNLTNGRYARW